MRNNGEGADIIGNFAASIVIPTFNRLNELELTLNSLVLQQCKYPFEVIVADDGSSEDTKAVAQRYIGKLNIRYCFQEDKGFRAGTARNMGIRLAYGEICIFIDNGIILHSKAVERHIEAHRRESVPCAVIGYVHAFLVEQERIGELLGIIEKHTPDGAVCELRSRGFDDRREEYYKLLGDDLSKWPAPFMVCWSCNISAGRETLLKVGMFDEFFVGWGHEDLELGMSLFKDGVKFVLEREACGIHYPHELSSQGAVNAIGRLKENRFREIKNKLKRNDFLRGKHPIREVEVFLMNPCPIESNLILLEERKNVV